MNYTYDELGRVTTRTAECGVTAGKLTSTYEYVNGGYGTNSTTPLVKKITQNGISFEYAYDSRGNIISEKRNGIETTYAYDALGQLIRVNDPHENATWVYNYDHGGNITSKVKYAYTTGTLGTALQTIPYVYGDSNWKDKLTGYDGQTITYDAIGNPTNDGAWTFTWAAGRQLKKMVREDRTLDFKYDHNGMRIQKVLQHNWYPETTKYTYHGKLLTHMTVNYTDWDEVAQQDKLHFFYDAQSRPVKVSYNGVIYTYVHNLQGDVVGLLDNSSNLVVEYKYDAWGRPLSIVGTLADTLGKRNPFRYRGYVYDEETELYYLRSRYYNPLTNQFLNCDIQINFTSLRGQNVYAYCECNPVIYADTDGTCIHRWYLLGLVDCDQCKAKKSYMERRSVKYNVPLYAQGAYNLCWAFCQIMVESYKSNTIHTSEEATNKAIKLAQKVTKSDDISIWNKGNWPTNMVRGMKTVNSIGKLYEYLFDGPVYAYYCSTPTNPEEDVYAHLVVVTGVDLDNDLVYTNNPWGASGSQSFSDFQSGVLASNGETNTIMSMRGVYLIEW